MRTAAWQVFRITRTLGFYCVCRGLEKRCWMTLDESIFGFLSHATGIENSGSGGYDNQGASDVYNHNILITFSGPIPW